MSIIGDQLLTDLGDGLTCLIASVNQRLDPPSYLFDFVKPVTEKSHLTDWMKARGPSPFSATLRTSSEKRAPLDKILTHGAALSFE